MRLGDGREVRAMQQGDVDSYPRAASLAIYVVGRENVGRAVGWVHYSGSLPKRMNGVKIN